jgi:hypothetical protein
VLAGFDMGSGSFCRLVRVRRTFYIRRNR